MEKRLAEIKTMIQLILRVPNPLKKSLPHCYDNSPFVDAIAIVEMPTKFTFPNKKLYDGTIDPNDHIDSYKQRMFTTIRPRELLEDCMYKSFRETFESNLLVVRSWKSFWETSSRSNSAQESHSRISSAASIVRRYPSHSTTKR